MVRAMAYYQTYDKPLSEPIVIQITYPLGVIKVQWCNKFDHWKVDMK